MRINHFLLFLCLAPLLLLVTEEAYSAEELVYSKTYFFGGAIFRGEEDQPVSASVSQVFIKSNRELLENLSGQSFHVVKSSILHTGSNYLNSGLFCLKYGRSIPKKFDKIDKLYNSRNEIIEHYFKNDSGINSEKRTLTLIGSSYGSVVAAQVMLNLLSNRSSIIRNGKLLDLKNVKLNLILTANPVDHESELYTKLKSHEDSLFSLTDISDPRDPMVGAVGTTKKEAFHTAITLSKEVLKFNMYPLKHHLDGMGQMKRVDDLIRTIYLDLNAYSEEAKERAIEFLAQKRSLFLAEELKEHAEDLNIKKLNDKGIYLQYQKLSGKVNH